MTSDPGDTPAPARVRKARNTCCGSQHGDTTRRRCCAVPLPPWLLPVLRAAALRQPHTSEARVRGVRGGGTAAGCGASATLRTCMQPELWSHERTRVTTMPRPPRIPCLHRPVVRYSFDPVLHL